MSYVQSIYNLKALAIPDQSEPNPFRQGIVQVHVQRHNVHALVQSAARRMTGLAPTDQYDKT